MPRTPHPYCKNAYFLLGQERKSQFFEKNPFLGQNFVAICHEV
jgi:hypothetical protein